MNDWDYDCWIAGEPASAKNQRRIVQIKGKVRVIKSAKALSYCRSFAAQAKKIDLLEGDVALRVDAFYASRRPDLACLDLVQDCLQGIAIKNDRQVKATECYWNLDRKEPRIRVRLKLLPSRSSVGTSSYKRSTIWASEDHENERMCTSS
tara:strand:+ start:832 stop:1281 length:450 start_codon:yes stop_codon:yes gene_type:complete